MLRVLFSVLMISISLGLAGQVAPDFHYETADNKVATLSNLKGEVVYLSFWASWCGPCKKNFQKYHELRTQLQEEGVILLNISLDKDKSKWDTALKKHNFINGINGHATDLASIQAEYKVSKVPDYHIIGKNGQFVFLSDSPDRNILEEFRQWLH